jgi:PAS domain S-box-containing protein
MSVDMSVSARSASQNRGILRFRSMHGVIVVLATVGLLEFLRFLGLAAPNPQLFTAVAVTYAAYAGGYRGGLMGAAIGVGYALYFFSSPDGLFHYTSTGLSKVVVNFITLPMIAILVSKLNAKLMASLRDQSDQRHRLLTTVVPVGIFEADRDGKYTYVNETWSNITGISSDKAAGSGWLTALWPEDSEQVSEEWRRAVENKSAFRMEYRFRRTDGEIRWVYAQSLEMIDAEGNPAGFIGTVTDISENKQAETQVRRSEARLAAILELAGAAIISMDNSGRIELFNDGAEETFGYAAEEMIGQPIDRLLPKRFREAHRRHVDEFAAGSVVNRPMSQRREIVGLRKNGEEFPANASIAKVDRGDAMLFTVILHDITDRKEAEEGLRQAQKMEAVGQLTGGVAHDFNNLLAVIMGNTELLQARLGYDDKLLDAVCRAAARGAELTQRLLAFSRRQPLRPQTVDLEGLVSGLSEMLARTLGETVEIETEAEADLWEVAADAGQVENALLNLAINARDAMPEGGKLSIECANAVVDEAYRATNPEAEVGDYVMLAVSDNGTGMSAAVKAHAFEPFFTTKEVGQGSGLGLSMVYGFVKQSGGQVTIDSELGKGTTVKLYLPRTQGTVTQATPFSEEAVPLGKGQTVLVIEDDEDVRDLAILSVENLGYQAIAAPEAAVAREIFDNGIAIDVVLSDVVLPGGMSGPEFAEELRARASGLPVIFMSGYPAEAAKRDGFLGADKVLLNKPFQLNQLARALRDALD